MNYALSQRLLSDKFLKGASKATLATMLMLVGAAAMATATTGTGAAFSGAVTMITSWLSGSLGVLVSLAVFTTGIMITVTKHSLMPVAVAAAAALAINVGPGVLSGMFTATI